MATTVQHRFWVMISSCSMHVGGVSVCTSIILRTVLLGIQVIIGGTHSWDGKPSLLRKSTGIAVHSIHLFLQQHECLCDLDPCSRPCTRDRCWHKSLVLW